MLMTSGIRDMANPNDPLVTYGDEKLTAWQMGFKSYAKGLTRARNPFSDGYPKHSWDCGWWAAEDEHQSQFEECERSTESFLRGNFYSC